MSNVNEIAEVKIREAKVKVGIYNVKLTFGLSGRSPSRGDCLPNSITHPIYKTD